MKKVTPARKQIQPLTDGLTGINYTACTRSLRFFPRLMAALCFPFLFLNAGFEMGYLLFQCNCIPNVLGTYNLNFNLHV